MQSNSLDFFFDFFFPVVLGCLFNSRALFRHKYVRLKCNHSSFASQKEDDDSNKWGSCITSAPSTGSVKKKKKKEINIILEIEVYFKRISNVLVSGNVTKFIHLHL